MSKPLLGNCNNTTQQCQLTEEKEKSIFLHRNRNLMLKTPSSRASTRPRTPTTKNGKFVITFNVLGTPGESKIIRKHQNEIHTKTYDLVSNVGGYREDCACQRIGGAWESEGFWEWRRLSTCNKETLLPICDLSSTFCIVDYSASPPNLNPSFFFLFLFLTFIFL